MQGNYGKKEERKECQEMAGKQRTYDMEYKIQAVKLSKEIRVAPGSSRQHFS